MGLDDVYKDKLHNLYTRYERPKISCAEEYITMGDRMSTDHHQMVVEDLMVVEDMTEVILRFKNSLKALVSSGITRFVLNFGEVRPLATQMSKKRLREVDPLPIATIVSPKKRERDNEEMIAPFPKRADLAWVQKRARSYMEESDPHLPRRKMSYFAVKRSAGDIDDTPSAKRAFIT